MAKIAIVGAGQTGLFLGFGLLEDGHEVTLLSDQTSDQILGGRLPSGMGLFEEAMSKEAELGLLLWEDELTPGLGVNLNILGPDGSIALKVNHPAPRPHRSVDQRLKNSTWMRELERRGATVRVAQLASPDDIDRNLDGFDLAVVATGKSKHASIFERDPARGSLDRPQRNLIAMNVKNFRPDVQSGTITMLPGAGEVIHTPYYNREKIKGRMLLIEAVPGGPLDRVPQTTSGREVLEASKALIKELIPGQFDDLDAAELVSEQCWLRGSITPTVRKPVARLGSGRAVLGLGDAVMAHDPLAAQGGNTGTRMADFYRQRISERGDGPFDAAWMQGTFDDFWDVHGQHAMAVSNGLLMPPPPHMQALLAAASGVPEVAAAVLDGLYYPSSLFPWFAVPAAAEEFLRARAPAPMFEQLSPLLRPAAS